MGRTSSSYSCKGGKTTGSLLKMQLVTIFRTRMLEFDWPRTCNSVTAIWMWQRGKYWRKKMYTYPFHRLNGEFNTFICPHLTFVYYLHTSSRKLNNLLVQNPQILLPITLGFLVCLVGSAVDPGILCIACSPAQN